MTSFSLIGFNRNCNHEYNCDCKKYSAEMNKKFNTHQKNTRNDLNKLEIKIDNTIETIYKKIDLSNSMNDDKLNRYKDTILLLESSVESLETDRALHQVCFNKLRNKFVKAFKVIDNMKAILAEQGDDIKNMNISIDRNSGDIHVIKGDIITIKSAITELQHDNTIMRSDIIDLQIDNKMMKSDITDLQDDNTNMKSDITAVKSDINIVNSKLDNYIEQQQIKFEMLEKESVKDKRKIQTLEHRTKLMIDFFMDDTFKDV